MGDCDPTLSRSRVRPSGEGIGCPTDSAAGVGDQGTGRVRDDDGKELRGDDVGLAPANGRGVFLDDGGTDERVELFPAPTLLAELSWDVDLKDERVEVDGACR